MFSYAVAAATFFSTLLGGALALRFRDRLHLILGFTAGYLLGVVSFEIFPEIIEQVASRHLAATPIMAALVVAFLGFHVLEKSILLHHAHESAYAQHRHPQVGMLSALAFVGHSFMDGVGIGLGFQVSPAMGLIVATAVISHDFTDGMNTVSVMLAHNNSQARSAAFLALDAAAPIAGVALTRFVAFPERALPLYLGAFAGFLLYIGAADILPEAHSERSSGATVAMTIAGAAAAFGLSRYLTP